MSYARPTLSRIPLKEGKYRVYIRSGTDKEFIVSYSGRFCNELTPCMQKLKGRYYYWKKNRTGKWYFPTERKKEVIDALKSEPDIEVIDTTSQKVIDEYFTDKPKYDITEEQMIELYEYKYKHSYFGNSRHRCNSGQLLLTIYKFLEMIGKQDKMFKGRWFFRIDIHGKARGIYRKCPIDTKGEFVMAIKFGLKHNFLTQVRSSKNRANSYYKFINFDEERLVNITKNSKIKGVRYAPDNTVGRIDFKNGNRKSVHKKL